MQWFARPTAKQAHEVFIARSAIECAIISCITPERMALFAEEIARQQHNEHQSFHAQDRRRIVYELGAFHELMARIAGNDVLRGILDNLMILSSLIVMLYQQDVTTHCQCDEHKNIIAALQEGDTQRAQNLMSDHLHALLQQLNLNETPPNLMTLSQALNEMSE
ncbi:transcriptional regulator NanR [Raoultella terrigena]|uniref:Transcriptional regulator NanR n=1 Tax=Raoultella terrigena TaxID=577 RepID=A0A4U9CYX9_RAOTE|nr:transcriptional regulator NanR [Raoultella terrigena]